MEKRTWIHAAAIRAIKTVAQTAVATIGTVLPGNFKIEKAKKRGIISFGMCCTIGTAAVLGEVNWIAVASASALAGILSLLTSVAGLPEVEK